MDFVTQLPETSKGYDALMVVVDRLTRMTVLIPTYTHVTAPEAARLFFEHVFTRYGMPTSIVSDRDPRFTGNFWQHLYKCLGTKLRMSSAYHPQTDGLTERMNRTVEQMLRNYVNDMQEDWDDHLAATEFAVNNTEQASTKATPFSLVHGRQAVTPVTLLSVT